MRTAEGLSREQLRSRRRRAVRAKTISVKRMPKPEINLGRVMYPARVIRLTVLARPATRGECAGGPRPCPFVSCRHHLYLDVSARTGSITLNFPDVEVEDMAESCALDVADRGGGTLEEVGALLNLTRERLRQLEVLALERAERSAAAGYLEDLAEDRYQTGPDHCPAWRER